MDSISGSTEDGTTWTWLIINNNNEQINDINIRMIKIVYNK